MLRVNFTFLHLKRGKVLKMSHGDNKIYDETVKLKNLFMLSGISAGIFPGKNQK